MQRSGKGGNRITAEEAYQRVKWGLHIGKAGYQLLQLTIPRVNAIMKAEWSKTNNEAARRNGAAKGAATKGPVTVPKSKGKCKTRAKTRASPHRRVR